MNALQPRQPELRGTCQQAVEKLVEQNTNLTAVRGWYLDTCWGPQEHWWATTLDGEIIDPTVEQFPTGHIPALRSYQPYEGVHPCPGCGAPVESEQMAEYCCGACHGSTVGIFVGICSC